MAVKKQTGKKTLGAPAPRVSLGRLRTRTLAPKFPTRRSMRIAKVNAPVEGNVDARVEQSNNENMLVKKSNNFCSSCRNGGTMNMCTLCPRVFCNDCVRLPPGHLEEDKFKCPHCHIFSGDKGVRAKKPSPYPYTIVGGATQRELYPLCDEMPLIIISIRLASISPYGLPPVVVYHHLYSYLPGAIEFYDCPFDFTTPKSIRDYRLLIRKIVEDVLCGRISGLSRFAVYITDHADTERGDLHCASNNQGAINLNELVNELIPVELSQIIGKGIPSQNTLTFLAGGTLVNNVESRADLQCLSASTLFAWVMAFGQKNFQPSQSNLFLADVALHWFIQHRAPSTIIYNHQVIGAHTDIHMLYPDGKTHILTWSHPGLRPFGQPSPMQCARCMSLKPWDKPKRIFRGNEIVQYCLHCRHCKDCLTFDKAEGMRMLKDSADEQTDRGDWFLRII